jgi:hypothetical protein
MGYDLYVIKSEHDVMYGNHALSELHNFKDEWYIDKDHEYSHRIWREWRNGFYEDENGNKVAFPEVLNMFFYEIHCPITAIEVADKLDAFAGSDIDIGSFTEWLRFWAGKDARFALSV